VLLTGLPSQSYEKSDRVPIYSYAKAELPDCAKFGGLLLKMAIA
jgi:hypothetical protein